MQNLRWLVLAVPLLLSGASQAATDVTILTWNLEWFPGGRMGATEPEAVVQMSRAREAMLDIRPDIMALQEVRDYESVDRLCSILPGMIPVTVSRFLQNGHVGPQQVAIASRFAADSAWSEAFKPGDTTPPPRGFAFAAVPVAGKFILLYSVHLKSNRGGVDATSPVRVESVRQLKRHAAEMERLYGVRAPTVTVISGDFNSDFEQPQFSRDATIPELMKDFKWAWSGIPREKRITWPGSGGYPDACFDGFFIRGNAVVVNCRLLQGHQTSDHNPSLLTLRLGE